MKGGKEKKSVHTEFVMSEQDAELVRERMWISTMSITTSS